MTDQNECAEAARTVSLLLQGLNERKKCITSIYETVRKLSY